MGRYVWTAESVVEIHARSSVHPIHGEVHDVRGEAWVENDGTRLLLEAATGYVEMDVDALKSGNKLEDFELRRRLDAKKFPTIRYELAEASGDDSSAKLRGSLTFHGESREFVEEVSVREDGGRLLVDGEHTFNIEEWGVKAPKILKLQVFPEVRVVARLVATAQPG